MLNKYSRALFAVTAMTAACTAQADPQIEAAARAFVENQVKGWLGSPLIVSAIRVQNTDNSNLTQSDIDRLDQQWRKETENTSGALIDSKMNTPLSDYLRSVKSDTGGLVTEIFVMDNKGLNVGLSDVTSDLWQGDEAKWQKTFPMAPSTVFVDEVEKDESTQTYQTQISVSIVDPDTQKNIGAITIGVDAEGLLMQ